MPRRATEDENLGDSAPADHGVFSPDRWSGCITVKLTTETPLLVPDAQHAEEENRHKTYPVRMVGGKPYLSPTSVKGMLRSAYEAITNSRMGVFNEYSVRPGFRTPPREGLKLVPARIELHSGSLRVRLLPGTSTIGQNGPGGPMYAAFLETYDGAVRLALLPAHGQRVWFQKRLEQHRRGFQFWRVTDMTTIPQTGGGWTEGYFFRSGPNADNKHYERIFFYTGNQQYVCDLTPEVQAQWKALIGDYQKIHEEEMIRRRLTRPPVLKNERCEWSYQIADPA